jgi:hypothetical protein
LPSPRQTEAILRALDKADAEESLAAYVRLMWSILEPGTPLVWGWPMDAIIEHLEAVTDGEIRRLLINVPPGSSKTSLCCTFWPSWEQGPQGLAHYRYILASYASNLTEIANRRTGRLIASPLYQALWCDRFRITRQGDTLIENDKTGWIIATSVGGVATGRRGDRVIIDDPNKVDEAESQSVRDRTNFWFTEVMPDRLNNLTKSAIVVIQQRTHEEDVSGVILDGEFEYVHLCIPAEYDSKSHCSTVIGWNDPRGTEPDEDGEPDPYGELLGDNARAFHDGELFWPDRFPESALAEQRITKGPYGYCTPGETPILMADLSLSRIDAVREGDSILGFVIGTKEKRARLLPTNVKSVSVSRQPVVKITLDSGRVIRCTPDHKWWTGRNDKSHPMYLPARAPGMKGPGRRAGGSDLFRVCPPELPNLSEPDDVRAAGWLAGFFDGEGSVSVMRRQRGDFSALITFTQGTGRNAPLCRKLEETLSRLGFRYGVTRRQPNHQRHGVNSYYLLSDAPSGKNKGGDAKRSARLPLYQRFVHVVQPQKWREHLINSGATGRLFTSRERVTAIVPDGVETVYGLETGTGNYVAWGLASSNSGQYNQSPSPRGGGIIKREWWQLYSRPVHPSYELVIAVLDTNQSQKEMNDFSALVILGVFQQAGHPNVMLSMAWRAKLELNVKALTDDERRTLGIDRLDLTAWERDEILNGRLLPPRSPPPMRGEARRPLTPMERSRILERVGALGLVDKIAAYCDGYKVDRLLIENKANGFAVDSEIRRQHPNRNWSVEMIDPEGKDKTARAHSVVPVFAGGLVWAPGNAETGMFRDWAEMTRTELAVLPRGKNDDLADCVVHGLRWLRQNGVLMLAPEIQARADQQRSYENRKPQKALYPG